MKKLYQRTFEQVLEQAGSPPDHVKEQRRALASRCSHAELEVTAMTTRSRRPIRILVTAAAVAAALTVGALAASGALRAIPLLSGGAFSSVAGTEQTGPDSMEATVIPGREDVRVPAGEEPDLLTVRGGRAYFTTETGEELDITGEFSETAPYIYSYTASDGSAHDIVIGGTPEDYGYMEYVYDADGSFVGSAGILPDGYDHTNSPLWLAAYEAASGLSA